MAVEEIMASAIVAFVVQTSDPSCFTPQPSDCTTNPSDPSCQQPSCPTIAIGMPCTPPNSTSAFPRNSTSSSSTSSAGGGS